MHHCEHDVGDAATVRVQSRKIGIAIVPEDTIEGMDGPPAVPAMTVW
jgi:hypothetical protein